MYIQLFITDGDSAIIEKKAKILKKFADVLNRNEQDLYDDSLSVIISGGSCPPGFGRYVSVDSVEPLLPARARHPRSAVVRDRPSPDFFEEITFEGKKGSLANPYVNKRRSDGHLVDGKWCGQTNITIDQFIQKLRQATSVSLTKVDSEYFYVREPFVEALAARYNQTAFRKKYGDWFEDFIHLEWNGSHSLYCLDSTSTLEEWWDAIKKEIATWRLTPLGNLLTS